MQRLHIYPPAKLARAIDLYRGRSFIRSERLEKEGALSCRRHQIPMSTNSNNDNGGDDQLRSVSPLREVPHLYPHKYSPSALFNVDVSRSIGKEYIPLLEDVIRMTIIQVTIQLMLFLSGSGASLVSWDFVCVVAYVVLGVMLYWLVFKNLVTFR